MDHSMDVDCQPNRHSRFELAAPRHFLRPAVLLLIIEKPRHGYSLAKDLQSLRLGRVDRPSVYRVLAELEADGLVSSFADTPIAGQSRRTYQITEQGEQLLRQWMGVIKDERDALDRVLRRYVATESLDARLAEVASGWQAITNPVFSPVYASSRPDGTVGRSRLRVMEPLIADESEQDEPEIRHYELNPERSVVMIDARSSVGPISFGALGATGTIDIAVAGRRLRTDTCPTAHVELAVDRLRSGNGLYDAELMRRIEGRRYPIVSVDLRACQTVGSAGRYRLRGDVTCHGATRPLDGAVEVSQPSPRTLLIRGEQTLDIRDFGVVSPTVLMLRIYPDVVVKIQIEADLRE
jgi:DNA-binding PadR family transcriptional regulator